MKYDLAVIGGGPAGYSGALKAAKLGQKVVLFESDRVGGTCLNVGCIPTKCYVSQAETIEKIRRATENGIFKDAGQFSYKKIFEEKERVVKRLTNGVAGLLRAAGVTVVDGKVESCNGGRLTAGGKEYEADSILIATGSKNFDLPIPGAKGSRVLDSTALLALTKMPKSIVIIGAGVIGLEFACILNTFGSKVTAVDVLPSILPNEDAECTGYLYESLKKRGIDFRLGAKVVSVGDENGQKSVKIEKDGTVETIGAEYVLIGAGRAPANDVAKMIGVKMDGKGFVVTDDHMRTSVKNVYAAGDIAGGYLLAHAAYEEAETAVINAGGGDRTVDETIMPRCIFTSPSFAAAGLTEKQAAETHSIVTGKFPFAANGKALAQGMEDGFVKWVADKKDGRLLGCHIVGGDGAELIGAAVVALCKKAAIDDFEKMIFPHPTIGESMKEGALDCAGEALHIPPHKR